MKNWQFGLADIKTQAELRQFFWEAHPQYTEGPASKRQNAYPCDVRMAWVDFVDCCHRDGSIRDSLANRATL